MKAFFENPPAEPIFPSSARQIIAASAQETRQSCYTEYGRNPVILRDPDTGAEDLIYDPRDPEQIAPFGCLINAAKANGIIVPDEAVPDWQPELMGDARDLAEDLPEQVMLGPKEVGGGLGVLADPCNQSNIGSCVGACGTNVTEDTIRSETLLRGLEQFWPEISIRYMYFFCQGRFSRPGGDGAMTAGLVATLMTYDKGWVCQNHPELMVSGRVGGVVHERNFEGSKDYPLETRDGLPYDITACRQGRPVPRSFVEVGVQHRCGYGNGDIRRVRDVNKACQVFASGHVIFSGTGWPGGWGNVDRNGFCTSGWRGGGGGHEFEWGGYCRRRAQSGYGGSNTQTTELNNGDDRWGLIKNSWGPNFGLMGYTIVPFDQIVRSGYLEEAFTLSFVNGWDKTVIIDMASKYRL